MTITIYVDHYNEEVLTEKEYEERRASDLADLMEDTIAFYHWLDDEFSPHELWETDEEYRERIRNLWKNECEDIWEDDNRFTSYTLRI